MATIFYSSKPRSEWVEHFGRKGMRWGVRTDHSKTAKTMTTQQLREAIDRMNLERTYVKMMSEGEGPSLVSKGSNFVGSILGNSIRNVATSAVTKQLSGIVDTAIQK